MTHTVAYWDAENNCQAIRDMTPEEEAQRLIDEQKAVEQLRKSSIESQIFDLEAQVTQRRIREAVLTGDNTFIQDIENQIAILRGQL